METKQKYYEFEVCRTKEEAIKKLSEHEITYYTDMRIIIKKNIDCLHPITKLNPELDKIENWKAY